MAENEYKRLGCAVEGCVKKHKAIGLCQTHYKQKKRGSQPKGTTKDYVCDFCGANFSAMQKSKFCTKRCKTKSWQLAHPEVVAEYAKRRVRQSKAMPPEVKAKRAAERIERRPPVDIAAQRMRNKAKADAKKRSLHAQDAKIVSCDECGIQFCPLYGARQTRLCPCCKHSRSRAAASAAKAIRRAAQSSNPVDPYKVFHRDGWKCQICGVPTPKSKRGTYDYDAPELDHIHPLSKGGAHSYENTQCTCRKCNGMKSDKLWQPRNYAQTPLPVL